MSLKHMCLSNIGKDHNTISKVHLESEEKKNLTAISITRCVFRSATSHEELGAEPLIEMREAAHS